MYINRQVSNQVLVFPLIRYKEITQEIRDKRNINQSTQDRSVVVRGGGSARVSCRVLIYPLGGPLEPNKCMLAKPIPRESTAILGSHPYPHIGWNE